jgi:outer membrane protein OmpA-like peptidoglycan-associated protein
LTRDSISTVNSLAALLRAYPSTEIAVAGFTDNTGQPEANLALSSSRAEALKQLLVARGVEPARIEAVGFGQDHPIAPNDTPEGRLANRRSEVVVTKR